MKLRLPAAFALLSLALVMALVPNANGATTTIGSLPTNATPSPGYYLIVDDGVSNTWKSTINAVLGSSLGIPVTKTNGGTGLSSPNPTATGCGTISGTWPNNVIDTTGCTGNVVSVTGGNNIAIAASAPSPVVILASPTATSVPSACAGWSSTFKLTWQPCTGPSPVATAAAVYCAGYSSTFVTQYTNGACAIIGQSFISNVITVSLPNVAPSVGGYSLPFIMPPNMANPKFNASFGFCAGAGSGGNPLSWQWYESSGTLVYNSSAALSSTSYAMSSNTSIAGGATSSPVAIPTSTTPGNPTYLYVKFITVPNTAPSPNCGITLDITQTVQLGPP